MSAFEFSNMEREIKLAEQRFRKCLKVIGVIRVIKITMVILALAGLAFAAFCHFDLVWDWLVSEQDSNFETSRNIALILAAFIGLPLAAWRSWTAHNQAKSALQQSESAFKQVEISERGLRSERFQKGADMLGSKIFVTRMGGIHELRRLAWDHPEDYLYQIISLLADFVRHPVRDEEMEEYSRDERSQRSEEEKDRPAVRRDIIEAVRAIGNLNDRKVECSMPRHHGVDLTRARLAHADLSCVNLSHAKFFGANLSHAKFFGANLTGANIDYANLSFADFESSNLSFTTFYQTNLSCVNFQCADLNGTSFTRTDISGTDFSEATRLSKEKLDQACHKPGSPPKNLPPGLVMDEEAAVERWKELYGDTD